LIERLATNSAFAKIGAADVARIVEALFESGALQLIDERVQLAPKVERRFSFRNFGDLASVFTSDSTVDVVSRDQVVGFVQRWYLERVSRQTEPTFLLSGSPWAIQHWDQRKGIVEVVRAERARAPIFLGGAMELSEVVGKSIQAVLAAPDSTLLPPDASLDPSAALIWKGASDQSASSTILSDQNVLKRLAGTVRLTTYAGLRINRTIAIMLIHEGATIVSCSNFAIVFKSPDTDEDIARMIATLDESRATSALQAVDADTLGTRLKFIDLLPPRIQHECVIDALTDLRGALTILRAGVRPASHSSPS
jgi:Lhr-like helicase